MPKCPKCSEFQKDNVIMMVNKSEVILDVYEESGHLSYNKGTIYQCPKCKNIEVI